MPKVRGIDGPTNGPRVLVVDDDEFDDAYLAGRTEGASDADDRQLSTLLWFWNRALANADRAQWRASQVFHGLYNRKNNCLFLRRSVFGDETGADFETSVELAHEVEHFLQVVVRAPPSTPSTLDAQLAQWALREGDATVGAVLYVGRMTQRPLPSLLRSLADWSPALGSDAITRIFGRPYRDGTRFVLALFRPTGNFRLVDEALANPPSSTAQILHPDKYRAHLEPVALPAPPLAAGYTPVVSDRAGELVLDEILARCDKSQTKLSLAEGWAGDSFVVAQSSDGPALSWLLAWDDTAAAARFAATLQAARGCLLAGAEPATLDVVRDDRLVAIAAGLPADRNRQLARDILQAATVRTGTPLP